jgi:hypothetical protein
VISYGAVFHGVGTAIDWKAAADSTALPWKADRRRIGVGVAMRYPSPASLRRTILSVCFSNEKALGEDGVIYKGGAEIFPVRVLALRMGYSVAPETNALSLGVGVTVGALQFDYALSRRDAGEGLHFASVSFGL